MTASLERQPANAGIQARDLRRFWRIVIAVALPIGPLGITVVRGLIPYWTDQDTETIIENTVAHPDVMSALLWVELVLTPPLLLGVLVLGYVARRGAPVLATVGAGLSFVAFANGGVGEISEHLTYVMGREGYSVEEIESLVIASWEHPVTTITGITWVVGHIVGIVLLAIALARSGVLPRWGAWALGLSQPIHLVAAVIVPSRLLDVTLGWGMTTVGFALVSLALLRMDDDDFDLPPTRRS